MSGKRVRDDFEGTEGNGNERNGSIEDGEVMAKPLTEEEELEAKKFAEIAARAEAKAAARTAARLAEKTDSIAMPPPAAPAVAPLAAASTSAVASEDSKSVKFLTKKEREELAMQRLQKKHLEKEKLQQQLRIGHDRFITGEAEQEKKRTEYLLREKMEQERIRREKEENKDSTEQNHEIKAIRNQYLGISNKKKRVIKPSEKFTKIFQFDWEETDDTGREDLNPLYNHRVKINPLFGRGYIAGIDLREQRKDSNYLNELMSRRVAEAQREQHGGEDNPNSSYSSSSYASGGAGVLMKLPIQLEETNDRRLRAELKGKHWSEKSLSEMNERDWRIFREDFDIRIQGGRASLPMRFWNESGLPTEILQAIEAMGYEQPSPIQRQAIPIGMDRKDIIGIAETGSGKTCAFLVPLLNYMLQLPPHQIGRTCDEGPLAIVMAPTRELAQQIQEECIKLAKFTTFQTCSVVGGQSIEEQGFILRRGVEIVIGTPGRLVDCLENNYLVLNQCNYVVLDEADRMIDMGFEPQVIQVLDAMGGLLKSDDETLVEQQARAARNGESLYRVTAMFSATMPQEVERIAKCYLRHPVSIKIGDEGSGKNKRIEQLVYFVAEPQKKSRLMEQLRRLTPTDKVIIFVNLKRQGDTVGSYVSQCGLTFGVIHGGKSQDQREEALEMFRNDDIQILVATDVAGRGLDIPDVTHVINYDMPKNIENYCHRIGRTARAGKSGIAITFVTESDAEVMYDLKTYLESTDAVIPMEIAKHQAAQAAVGTRDASSGKLVGERKRDQILYAK